MKIGFNKIWAESVKGLEFPSDADLMQGFDYLGKLSPTTALHDVMFQRLDKKSLFTFTQIQNVCKRFSVAIDDTDDGKYDSALADAITSALKNQTKASELNTGITRHANKSETLKGESHDLSVNVANLAEYVKNSLKPYAFQNDLLNLSNSLSVIARTGVLTDAIGKLPWQRLDNVPEWLKTSSDDGTFVTLKSPDGTRLRLGKNYTDVFSRSNNITFRVNNETGSIESGSLDQTQVRNLGQVARDNNYYSLSNLPSLGEASKRPVFDTGDVNQIPWDGTSIPTTSVARALKDYSDRIAASISAIGKSNNINDAKGVLNKASGGTGRADGNIDCQWVFTPSGSITNRGFVLGSNLNNKITDGDDNEDPNASGNVTIDSWNSVAIRSSINNYMTTFKHCARSGLTYNRGDFAFFGGGEKEIRNNEGALNVKGGSNKIRIGYDNLDIHTKGDSKTINIDTNANVNFTGGGQVLLKNLQGRMGLMCGDGDAIWLEGGNKLFLRNSKDETRFEVLDGNVNAYGNLKVLGSTELRQGLELYGATPFTDFHFGNSDTDYTARLIANAVDRLTLQGSHMTIERDLTVGGRISGGGLGNGAYANFGGNGSAYSIAGNDYELVRSSQFVDLRNGHDGLSNRLQGMLDKSVFDNGNATTFDDLPWGSAQVPSTGHLRNVLGRVKWAEGRSLFNTTDAFAFGGSEWEIPTTNTLAAVRNWAKGYIDSLGSASRHNVRDPGSYDAISWSDDVPNMSVIKRVKDEITNVKSNLQNQMNDRITDVRWITSYNAGFDGAPSRYATQPNQVIGGLQIHDTVNTWWYGRHDLIAVRRLQVCKAGVWYDVQGYYADGVDPNFS